MPVISYSTTCLRKTLLASGVYEFVFSKPEGLTFQAGQFVLFDVPLIDDPTNIQTRAYSIASSPDEKDLLFIVKLIEGGRASRWFEEVVREGTQAIIKGPFGVFTLKDEPDAEYVFIATGTGIAPYRSHLMWALSHGIDRQIDLIFGVRTQEDFFWLDELRAIEKKHPNFHLHLTLTSPSPTWQGYTGRVQLLIPKIVTDFSKKHLYACGNPIMTKEVKDLALNTWGMEKKKVHAEGYV